MQVVSVPVSEAIISTAGQMFVLVRQPPVVSPVPGVGTGGGLFNAATGIGQPQTLWGDYLTLQYKPAPSLMTRVEFRYDHSNKDVFLDNDTAKTSQQTMSFSVVYLF